MNNGIRVIYPRTQFEILNQRLKTILFEKINTFMEIAKEAIQEKIPYTLDISHDEYHYQHYLSIVLYLSMETGGAHPDNQIFSLVFDELTNKFLTIDDFIKSQPDFLTYLSVESRKKLLQNPKIENNDMLLNGTSEKKENFQLFALTETGFYFYFPVYQVAPYSQGSFKIHIPYL